MAVTYDKFSKDEDAVCAVCLDPSNCGLYAAVNILNKYRKEPKLARAILTNYLYEINPTPGGSEVPCPAEYCAEFLKVRGL